MNVLVDNLCSIGFVPPVASSMAAQWLGSERTNDDDAGDNNPSLVGGIVGILAADVLVTRVTEYLAAHLVCDGVLAGLTTEQQWSVPADASSSSSNEYAPLDSIVELADSLTRGGIDPAASHWLSTTIFEIATALDATTTAPTSVCRHTRPALYFAIRRRLLGLAPTQDAQFALACMRAAHERAHYAVPGQLALQDPTTLISLPRTLEFHAEFSPVPRGYIPLRALGLRSIFAVAVGDSARREAAAAAISTTTTTSIVAVAARMIIEQHLNHGVPLDTLVEARVVDTIRHLMLAAPDNGDDDDDDAEEAAVVAAATLVSLAEERLAVHFYQRLGRLCNRPSSAAASAAAACDGAY